MHVPSLLQLVSAVCIMHVQVVLFVSFITPLFCKAVCPPTQPVVVSMLLALLNARRIKPVGVDILNSGLKFDSDSEAEALGAAAGEMSRRLFRHLFS